MLVTKRAITLVGGGGPTEGELETPGQRLEDAEPRWQVRWGRTQPPGGRIPPSLPPWEIHLRNTNEKYRNTAEKFSWETKVRWGCAQPTCRLMPPSLPWEIHLRNTLEKYRNTAEEFSWITKVRWGCAQPTCCLMPPHSFRNTWMKNMA